MTRKRKSRNSDDKTPKPVQKKQDKMSSFFPPASKTGTDNGEDIVNISMDEGPTFEEPSSSNVDIMNLTQPQIPTPAKAINPTPDIISDIQSKLECLLLIQKDVTSLKESIKDIVVSVQFTESRLMEAIDTIRHLNVENDSLQSSLKMISLQNKLLAQKINNMEDYSRRENILISGIHEERNENCFHIVNDILMHLSGENISIQRCHRVGMRKEGRIRDIIVRFHNVQDKMLILQRRWSLGKGVYINEDFSAETKRRINVLRPVFKEAKKIDSNSKMIKDKIIFRNKEYTVKNIRTINIVTSKLSEKTDKVTIAFAGRFSPLSNLYPQPIEIDGKLYSSTEHFYQLHKCLSAGNLDVAAEVLMAEEPEDAMAAGAKVQRPLTWTIKEGKQLMKKAAKEKLQSKKMQKILRETGKAVIVESTRNPLWGTGIPFNSCDALSPKSFTGRNIMGTVLMELRDELPPE